MNQVNFSLAFYPVLKALPGCTALQLRVDRSGANLCGRCKSVTLLCSEPPDKYWNRLTLGINIYTQWAAGECAFKCLEMTPAETSNGEAMSTMKLQVRWLNARSEDWKPYDKVALDRESLDTMLCDRFPLGAGQGRMVYMTDGTPALTGHIIRRTMPTVDAENMQELIDSLDNALSMLAMAGADIKFSRG